MFDAPVPDSTQSISRAFDIVQHIASSTAPGLSLSDISQHLQLSRTTAYRILNSLVAEGMIDFDGSAGLYSIGPLAASLGMYALKDFHSVVPWQGTLAVIAGATKQTTYLKAQSGSECVCLQVVSGNALVRIAPFKVGQRFPLGIGPGSMALLSTLTREDIEVYVDQYFTQSPYNLERFDFTNPEKLVADALVAKEKGYSLTVGTAYPELFGIGIVLPGANNPPLAISITAPIELLQAHSEDKLAAMMLREIMAAAAMNGQA